MTADERQANLDDLFVSCRAENAKRAFGEAVACFRAGAYRACIVVTWTAVVFDYLGKLRELEVAGNGDAATILVAFENARKSGEVLAAQKLEGEVLKDAEEKFELLTPIERQDLERLRLDRHRCAHPSLLTLDEPYQPPAELARVHMRNAVKHLLSLPPLQGREALARIWTDVSSEYFPEDEEAAATRLHARLSRARPSLLRTFGVGLTKNLLAKGEESAHRRQRAALAATIAMHHAELERLLREKLNSLADLVADDDLHLLLRYCRNIGIAWGCLNASHQDKVRQLVQRTPSMQALADASEITALANVVAERIGELGDGALATLAVLTKRVDLLDRIVQRLETSRGFDTFKYARRALGDEDLAPYWTPDHRRRLVSALCTNGEMRRYAGYPVLIRQVLSICRPSPDLVHDEWRCAFDLIVGLASVRYMAKEIRQVFPSFPEVSDDTKTADEDGKAAPEGEN